MVFRQCQCGQHEHGRYARADGSFGKGNISRIHDDEQSGRMQAENTEQHDDDKQVAHLDDGDSGSGQECEQGYVDKSV